MKTIKMAITVPGSNDGINVKQFLKGETYRINDFSGADWDISPGLANDFIVSGWVVGKKKKTGHENKASAGDENKSL